jgi:hypothetical protein
MSNLTLFDQLLNDPEKTAEGMSKAIVENLKERAVGLLIEQIKPTLEKEVEEMLERFRMHACRRMDSDAFRPSVDFKLWWADKKDK